jgi:hypothetical protein
MIAAFPEGRFKWFSAENQRPFLTQKSEAFLEISAIVAAVLQAIRRAWRGLAKLAGYVDGADAFRCSLQPPKIAE